MISEIQFSGAATTTANTQSTGQKGEQTIVR